MDLHPCDACKRHVDRGARACPFCGARIVAAGAPPRRPRWVRATRAAIFYFGAGAASACGTDPIFEEPVVQPYGAPPDPDPVPPRPPPEPEGDSIAQPYGAPVDPEYPPPPPVPEPTTAPEAIAPPYGAPPPPPPPDPDGPVLPEEQEDPQPMTAPAYGAPPPTVD